MTRRRRWILACLGTFIVALVAFALLGYWLLLPWIVRQQVVGAFQRLGLTRVSFDVRGSSLYRSDVANLSAGEDDLLKIGGVAVRYSPLRALRGELDSIAISDAKVIVDLDRPPVLASDSTRSSAAPSGAISLPFQRLDLLSSSLVLKRGGRELSLPLTGSISRGITGSSATITLTSAIDATPLDIHGTIDPASGGVELNASLKNADAAKLLALLPAHLAHSITSLSGSISAVGSYKRDSGQQNATLNLAIRGAAIETSEELDATATGIAADVVFDRLLALATEPAQTISIGALEVAGTKINDVLLTFRMNGLNDLSIDDLRGRFAGGEVRVAPFHLDLMHPVFSTTVFADHVDIGETVALVSQGKGTGSGKFSGSVPISIDFSRAALGDAVALGLGSFVAEPGGNLRLGEATAGFGEMLDQSNPAFADPEMADIKQGILDAVQDFDYDLLDVKFERNEGQDLIKMRLHGRGRTGERVPINLGISVQGGAELLNDYLALKSRVLSTGPPKASP